MFPQRAGSLKFMKPVLLLLKLDGNLNSEVTSCPEAPHLVSEEDRVCRSNEEDVGVNPTDQHLTIGLRFAKFPQVFVDRNAKLMANLSERPK